MNSLIAIIIFIFGAIIGSYLNVVVIRWNTGRGRSGRSCCMSCGKTLSWYELIPIFSFCAQGGKCRTCKTDLSPQYFLVEVLTGLTFMGVYLSIAGRFLFDPFYLFIALSYYLTIVSILICIALYDLKHKIIPNEMVYSFIMLSFIGIFLTQRFDILDNILAGPILAAPFALLWLLSKGRLMGFGDVKYMLGMGFFLGLSSGFSALLISFWFGAIVSILMMGFSRSRVGMKTEVPFGPFLVFATLVVLIFQVDFQTISSIFFR